MAAKSEKDERKQKLFLIFILSGLMASLLIAFSFISYQSTEKTVSVGPSSVYAGTLNEGADEIDITTAQESANTPEIPLPKQGKISKRTTLKTPYNNPPGPELTYEEEVFVEVSEMPEFPGGEEGLHEFVIKNYVIPPIVYETGYNQLKLKAQYTVEKDGRISNVKILKDGGSTEAAEELVHVLKKMPRWRPARQGGRAVRVRFILPVTIRIL